jgi:two-component system, LytTR family, response regulator
MLFKTLLIDDEKLAINRLERLLQKYPNDIEIIGIAYNGQEGLQLIQELNPDLIFLDIQMPLLTGFEMLAKLQIMPLVVFATAYEEYAVRAFEENSIDYLLKPIEPERLEITIKKLKNQKNEQQINPFSAEFFQLMNQWKPKKTLNSMAVKVGDKIILIKLEEISYFEAEDKYVYIYTLEGKKHLLDYSLTTLSEKLPEQFIRVSRSVILNSLQLKEIQKYFSGKFLLIMNDKSSTKITSGSSYAEEVKKLFEL